MSSPPISLILLNASATLYPYNGTVKSVKTYGEPITLESVYIRAKKRSSMSNLGESDEGVFSLYFDCSNSSPAGTVFSDNDKIVFGRNVLTVRAVRSASNDGNTVHHFEVDLVFSDVLPSVISGGVPTSVYQRILSGGAPSTVYSKQVLGGAP